MFGSCMLKRIKLAETERILEEGSSRTEEVVKQKAEIEELHDEIASIRYAKD